MRILTHFLKQQLPAAFGYTGRLRIRTLQGDGSDRKVSRLYLGGKTAIVVSHPKGREGSPSENDSFFYIARHLKGKGLPTPDIYAFDADVGLFLMQDFGDFSVESVIKKIKESRLVKRAYEVILKLLLKIQIDGAADFDTRHCYDTPVYDGRFSWRRESQYFIEAFLKRYLKWERLPGNAEEELEDLSLMVDQEKTRLFLYRDFQSRNMMVWSGGIGLIDFQAARLGPPQYDLASLLIDPYVNLPLEIQQELLEVCVREFSSRLPVNQKAFKKNYEIIAFQRNLQILGAFSFLSQVKGKPYFEAFIPAALASLKKRISGKLFQPYKHVRRLIENL